MSSQILLYSGPGAGPFCVQALENQFKDLADDRLYQIRRIHSLSECFSDPQSVCSLFVPGGNAVTMYLRSDLSQLSAFKTTMQRYNISYYGTCAGALMASENIHLRLQIPLFDNAFSYNTECFSKLYPGHVLAPLFPSSPELSVNDFRVLPITIAKTNNAMQSVHILSPGLLDCQQDQNTEILSCYSNLEPMTFVEYENGSYRQRGEIQSQQICESIYYKSYNSPPVLLTGSHPEIDSAMVNSEIFRTAFNATLQEQKEIVEKLSPEDAARKDLLRGRFKRINITCKEP